MLSAFTVQLALAAGIAAAEPPREVRTERRQRQHVDCPGGAYTSLAAFAPDLEGLELAQNSVRRPNRPKLVRPPCATLA